MEIFLNTYFQAKALLNDDTILIDQNYQNVELANGYPIAKWRNDDSIDREIRRRFYRMINHSVTFTSAEFREEASWLVNAEFIHSGKEAKGCLIAYERDDLVISFLSDPYWKCSEIEGTYTVLDDDGNILEENKAVSVSNVSYCENLSVFGIKYKDKIGQLGKTTLKSGRDILKNQPSLLPNLVFCENAVRQLENNVGREDVAQVYRKLLELQRYFENIGEMFDKNALNNATPEADITLRKYKEDHTFILPSGERVVFSWHVRFTGAYAGRIFFIRMPYIRNVISAI